LISERDGVGRTVSLGGVIGGWVGGATSVGVQTLQAFKRSEVKKKKKKKKKKKALELEVLGIR
jgi:hypothetical protein